jgi:hypothetical protein
MFLITWAGSYIQTYLIYILYGNHSYLIELV